VQGRPISADEVRSRWEEIVAEIVRQKVSLKACMESATVGSVARNCVTILCTDEFSVSQALRNREFITETFSKILNAQARVEISAPPVEEGPIPGPRSARSVLGSPLGSPSGSAPGKGESRLTPTEPEHPMLTVLKRELGAEPLE